MAARQSKWTLLIWGAFAFASLVTVVVNRTLWYAEWYWEYLSILGIISAVLAVVALKVSGLRLWAVATVVLGLLIGQLWFVQGLVAGIIWSIRGFAP